MTKKCFKCGKKKELNQFYKHPATADKHLGKCKNCTKNDVRERYNDEESRKRIVAYEKKRFQNPERKKKTKQYAINRKIKHPNKVRANRAVHTALKNGSLKRLPCEVCGDIKSQTHHPDYRRPLYVKWLCFKHHREEHRQRVNEF